MRRPRPTAVVLCVAVVGLLIARGAHPAPQLQPPTSVVLFTPATADPLVARLDAEMAAVGIQVRRMNLPPDGQLEAAISREIARGASAAIRVIPRARGAEVWTAGPSGKTLRRQTTGTGTTDVSVMALQTVEFVRATLLEGKQQQTTRDAERPASGEGAPPDSATADTPARHTSDGATVPAAKTGPGDAATPPPAATAPPATPARTTTPRTRQRLPEWGLELPPEMSAPREPLHLEVAAGPAFVVSPGGVRAITAAAAFGRARLSPTSRFGLELMAVMPVAPALLHNPEGIVETKAAVLGAALSFQAPAPRRLRADAALGASAVMVRTLGRATGFADAGTAPNVGTVETGWRMAAHVRLGGGVDLTRWLCLRADVIGGLTARRIIGYDVTTVDGRTITRDRATWGPAFATATLGLQASW